MTYYQVTVVMMYRDLSSFQSDLTAFTLEDTDDMVNTYNFLSTLHSNKKYEIVNLEYEFEPMAFNDPTDPRICNTIH
jgi:hypothetical protein